MDCGFNAGKEKSKTFPGIAKAMAEQWGKLSEVKPNSSHA